MTQKQTDLLPAASSICPYCGKDKLHSHTDDEIQLRWHDDELPKFLEAAKGILVTDAVGFHYSSARLKIEFTNPNIQRAWLIWRASALSTRKADCHEELVEAARALQAAVTYGGISYLGHEAGAGYKVRVPEQFITDLDAALAKATNA